MPSLAGVSAGRAGPRCTGMVAGPGHALPHDRSSNAADIQRNRIKLLCLAARVPGPRQAVPEDWQPLSVVGSLGEALAVLDGSSECVVGLNRAPVPRNGCGPAGAGSGDGCVESGVGLAACAGLLWEGIPCR